MSGLQERIQRHVDALVDTGAETGVQVAVCLTSAALSTGEIAQYEAGKGCDLALHLPQGVVLVVSVAITVLALWRPTPSVCPETGGERPRDTEAAVARHGRWSRLLVAGGLAGPRLLGPRRFNSRCRCPRAGASPATARRRRV